MRYTHIVLFIVYFVFSNAYTQDLNNNLEERIRVLESAIASLDTRLQTRTTSGAGSLDTSVEGLALQRRVDDLARQVESLSRQVTTLQRQAEQAGRDAAAATREAEAARRDARDALMRAR